MISSLLVDVLYAYHAMPVCSCQDTCRSTRVLLQGNDGAQACKKARHLLFSTPPPCCATPAGHVLLPLFFFDGQVHTGSDPATIYFRLSHDSWKMTLRAGENVYTARIHRVLSSWYGRV